MLTQILCPVDGERRCSLKPELTTQEWFLLTSLRGGCLALVLLSPVLVDRALCCTRLLTVQQNNGLLCWPRCSATRNVGVRRFLHSTAERQWPESSVSSVSLWPLSGSVTQPASLPGGEQGKSCGPAGVQGLRFASEFPNLLRACENEMVL